MGTLTADCPRLNTDCPHKLATSCRLTSTPNCCACADERIHSRTYRVYIDGVGFVNRGTRWQGYCWFCKEFWSNRLAATEPPLEIFQTRVPEIPDQTEFLERWWEFHQGYRIAKLPDGTEQRIAVMGEPFREVSPGFLPRTLDQLRAGVENDASRPENRLRRRRVSSEEERPEQPHQSLEDVLDNLLNEMEEPEIFDAEPMVPAEPRASVTPQIQEEPSEPPRPMTRREAQQQNQRERFARVFGSREELEQDDYESPLTQMYTRAFDRQRQADQRRAEGTEIAPRLDGLSRQDVGEIEEQLLWGVMQEPQSLSESLEWVETNNADVELETILAMAGGGDGASRPARVASTVEMLSNMRLQDRFGHGRLEALVSLDSQEDRPGPKTDAEMTKVLACQVCYQQIADVAVLPCGHMVMCQWCADVIVPVKHGHIPMRATKCPMCRKQVKQRFKIHTG